MDQAAWITSRIRWKGGQHGLPQGRTHFFPDLPPEMQQRLLAVVADCAGGQPVLACVDSPQRWTVLATDKLISYYDHQLHVCVLETLADVRPRDSDRLEEMGDEILEWKTRWEYLRLQDDAGRVTEVWVPSGTEAYALWNILRMFPALARSQLWRLPDTP